MFRQIENIGGIWDHDAFLEAMQDPTYPEQKTYKEWIGDSFDLVISKNLILEEINRHRQYL